MNPYKHAPNFVWRGEGFHYRQQRSKLRCTKIRGCTKPLFHKGPHVVLVSKTRIDNAYGLFIRCNKCGFRGSGGHTVNGVRCSGRKEYVNAL